MRTIEDIIKIMEEDLNDLPNVTEYDEGFRAGIAQALFVIRIATGAKHENTLEKHSR